jgi:UDP-2-acetamido-3-amino-2,3-dideoxy-glucuronate N-acetyltransferase
MKPNATVLYFAHPSAVVDEPCDIGSGTKIWHFTHVMAHAVIGEGCSIGQNVFIASRVRIGRNVKIQNNVSVYEGVELEDDVFCGPSMVFTNVSTPRSSYPRNDPRSYLRTLVKRGASIGANSTIVCGNTIGEYAFIGAGAVVTRDVPPRCVVYGNPARVRGYACECGEILRLVSGTIRCNTCGQLWARSADSVEKACAI